MPILTSKSTTYEYSLDNLKELIAADLKVTADRVTVTYVEGDIGPGDPMDRYPAPRGIVSIRVAVNEL